MDLIDYTGKLNNHNDYLKVINKLEEICEYIEIVIIDRRKHNELVDKFNKDVIDVKKVREWWGTKTNSKNNLYKIKATKELFDYLKKYETFCKYYEYGSNLKTLTRGDYSEITDFGIDDICFYDKNNNYLLYTTTHEGYIILNPNILI